VFHGAFLHIQSLEVGNVAHSTLPFKRRSNNVMPAMAVQAPDFGSMPVWFERFIGCWREKKRRTAADARADPRSLNDN
jgi:hypothetical protein